MTYKEIIYMINHYEKEYQTARYINGEHNSNYHKTKLLRDSYSNYLASLVALFDFVALSKSGVLQSNEEVEKHIYSIHDSIARKVENKTEENNRFSNTKSKDKKIKLEDELSRILNYETIYFSIFNNLLYSKDDRIKIIYKYADKKRKLLLENDQRKKKDDDDWFVANVYNEIKNNYDEYNLALQEHVNRLIHGGKDVEEFIIRKTNSSIKYILLIQAIKDATDAKDNSIKIKQDVIDDYYKKFFEEYVNGQTYQDSEELYVTYKDTFEKTYDLSQKPRVKLNRKISKLNKKRAND